MQDRVSDDRQSEFVVSDTEGAPHRPLTSSPEHGRGDGTDLSGARHHTTPPSEQSGKARLKVELTPFERGQAIEDARALLELFAARARVRRLRRDARRGRPLTEAERASGEEEDAYEAHRLYQIEMTRRREPWNPWALAVLPLLPVALVWEGARSVWRRQPEKPRAPKPPPTPEQEAKWRRDFFFWWLLVAMISAVFCAVLVFVTGN